MRYLCDTVILLIIFLIVNLNNVPGEVTDIPNKARTRSLGSNMPRSSHQLCSCRLRRCAWHPKRHPRWLPWPGSLRQAPVFERCLQNFLSCSSTSGPSAVQGCASVRWSVTHPKAPLTEEHLSQQGAPVNCN